MKNSSIASGEYRTFAAGCREYQKIRPSVMPVFLPFAGCPQRCVFCSQTRQTGITLDSDCVLWLGDPDDPPSKPFSIPQSVLLSFNALLQELKGGRHHSDSLPELAFYGGTFSLLSEPLFHACLYLAHSLLKRNLVSRVRCSTRPDALNPNRMQQMKDAGISLIELGIQSFSSMALKMSRRGYTSKEAKQGCENVLKAGFQLGIQLLPGMPGCDPETFLHDVQEMIAFYPACARFYPCLVIEGTALAALFRSGHYAPWDLDQTVQVLGEALRQTWDASIPVIRLSLAPEPDLEKAVIAGPRHDALGSMIMTEALWRNIQTAVMDLGQGPFALDLPESCRGFLFGYKGSRRSCLEQYAIRKVRFTDIHRGMLRRLA
ncbi:MAG: radical SAM protein [Desulfovibrionaceae bacterium]|nr:radical SAM protein [Desulfovibrionaceae bacterium]